MPKRHHFPGRIRTVGWLAIFQIGALTAAAFTIEAGYAQEQSAIELATAPLPRALRAGASVLIEEDGELRTLREGTNGIACYADAPGDTLFSVQCFSAGARLLRERRRELREMGVVRDSVDAVLEREVRNGDLPIAPGYFDASISGVLQKDGSLPNVLLWDGGPNIPFATVETTGLAEDELGEEGLVLMSAGRLTAHIHIRYKIARETLLEERYRLTPGVTVER